MNKYILSLILLVVIVVSVYPIEVDIPTCGVKSECHVDSNVTTNIPDYTDPKDTMRIVFNVPIRDDSTSPFLTSTQMSDIMDSLNLHFDSVRIGFIHTVHWVYSDYLCTTSNAGDNLVSAFEEIYFSSLDSQLNVIIGASNWTSSPNASQAGVQTPYTTNYRLRIAATTINDDLTTVSSSFTHEIGHILGLAHPFGVPDCGNDCREFSREYWEDTLSYSVAETDSILRIRGDAFSDTYMNGQNTSTAWIDTCPQGANVPAGTGNYMNWDIAAGGNSIWSPQQRGCVKCYLTSTDEPKNLRQWLAP